MQKPSVYFLTTQMKINNIICPAVYFTYETKKNLYDIITVRTPNTDKELELYQENGLFKPLLPKSKMEKMVPLFEKIKPLIQTYLLPESKHVIHGEEYTKSQLWWRIKEDVERLNFELQNTTNKQKKMKLK